MDYNSHEARQQLMDQVATFLQKKRFYAESQPNKSIFRLYHRFNGVQYQCFIVIRFSQQEVFFYFVPPFSIQEADRVPMAEFVARANYGASNGVFELSFLNGEINYRTTIRWRDQLFELQEIMDHLDTGVSVWGMYLQGVLAIVNDEATPEEALKRVRQPF